jgi:hypothetical protein
MVTGPTIDDWHDQKKTNEKKKSAAAQHRCLPAIGTNRNARILNRQIFWNPKFESKNTKQLNTEYDA